MPESREPLEEQSASGLPAASPMSLAIEWVARITAVSLLMFLPGVGGQWLDARLNTNFLTLLGFAFGFCVGLAVLLLMVKVRKPTSEKPTNL